MRPGERNVLFPLKFCCLLFWCHFYMISIEKNKTKTKKNFSTNVITWDFWLDLHLLHISWIQRENAAAQWRRSRSLLSRDFVSLPGWISEAIFTSPNFRAKKFYIIKWLFCVISTQTVKEISLWEQRVESRPPTPAYERAKRRRLGHDGSRQKSIQLWTCEPSDRVEDSAGWLHANFPRVQLPACPTSGRPSQHSFTSAGEVSSSFPSQKHEHDGCFGPPRFFFSPCGFFQSCLVHLAALLWSFLQLPSVHCAVFSHRVILLDVSFISCSNVPVCLSVGLNRFGNETEISGQNQNYIWKAEWSLSCVHDASGWQLLQEDFNRSLFFSSIRGLKSEKCRLAVFTNHSTTHHYL